MVKSFVYERKGEHRELAIWNQPVTEFRQGDDFVICLRHDELGRLSVAGVHPGSNVVQVMSHRSEQGQLQPNDIFVVHDSVVFTACDVTLTRRREHGPETCAVALLAAQEVRDYLDDNLSPREFDWSQHDLTPAYARTFHEIGSTVELGRNEHEKIVAISAELGLEVPAGPTIVVARDSVDGELQTSGRVVKNCRTYREAELLAVEITNRIWRELSHEPSFDRGR